MSGEKREPKHYAYIDAVRGLAFLAVLIDHCTYVCGPFPGATLTIRGYHGVQLFFLASAITLCFSMATRREGKRELLNFYLRRLFRIASLFWLSMVFYWTFPGIIPHSWLAWRAPGGIHAYYFLLTAFFLHGWHPYTFNCIVPGGWSIAVEMTFYLVFPFCFHHIITLRKAAFCVLGGAVFTLAEMFCFYHFGARFWRGDQQSNLMSFFVEFWFPSQFVVFLIGIFAYFLLKEPVVHKLYASRFWSCWLFAVSSMFLLTLLEHAPIGSMSLFLIVLCLAGIIISLAGNSIPLMVNPFICHVGKLSYSCYLTHFAALGIVLKVFGAVFPHDVFDVPGTVRIDTGHSLSNLGIFAVMMIATLALTLVFSTVTHNLVENPGIALGKYVIRMLDKSSPEKLAAPSRSPAS